MIDILHQLRAHAGVGVAYVYCSYKEQYRQSPTNLIASLLLQLVLQHKDVSADLLALYNKHYLNRTRPLLREYVSLLQDLINKFPKAYIVIDGLDECPESNETRRNFLAGIQSIRSQTCTFITSRDLPNLRLELQDATRVLLEPHDRDIRNYLEQRLHKWTLLKPHLKKDPELFEKIINAIILRAKGMFLMARLYIETLTRSITLRKVKAALTTLPEGLDSMYFNIMDRIRGQDDEMAALAIDVLSWVYYAKRPLTLQELQHALAIEPGDTFLDEDGMPDKDLLTSVCCGLLNAQEDEVVTFLHYTAQEFFQRHEETFFKDSRGRIPLACLTYLSLDVFAEGPPSIDEDFDLRLKKYPLLEYAATYWGVLVELADTSSENSEAIEKIAVELLQCPQAISSCVQAQTICNREYRIKYPNYSQEFPQQTPGLVLASTHGLTRFADLLLQNAADIEAVDSRGVRAIHQAIWQGHNDTARFLLSQNANLHVPIETDLQYLATYMQGGPIHLAAIKGNEDVLVELLARGADPKSALENGWTPLHMAAANGHSSIVTILLTQHDVDVDAADTHGGTVIYRAAELGHDACIKLLIDHRANVNLRSKLDQTPLLRAAENGQLATVKLLLEAGADWKVKDFLGWTPLYRAQDHGHFDVEILMKKWIREQREMARTKAVS